MAFWKKLFGSVDDRLVDYYDEGVALVQDAKYHEALTSFRLALKSAPGDAVVLQQIAICYTRIGMVDEATKTYQHVLQKDPSSSGAHYGLAFIMVSSESPEQAIPHLESFLSNAPRAENARSHVEHAKLTLAQLRGEAPSEASEPALPFHENMLDVE